MKNLLLIVLLVVGCKGAQPKAAAPVSGSTAKNGGFATATGNSVANLNHSEDDVVSTELKDLKGEINTYLETTKNEPTTEESLEFKKSLADIQSADPDTLREFASQQGFSKAEDKATTVAEKLKEQANDDDKQKVEGVLKGAAVFTVVLSSLAVLGTAVSLSSEWAALSRAGKVGRLSRGGISLGAAIIAGMILSNDKVDKDEVIALGGFMGIIAVFHAENAFTRLGASSQQIRAEEIRFEIRKELVRTNFDGDVYKQAEKIYSEAHIKQPTQLELDGLKGSEIEGFTSKPLVERVAYQIHDVEVNTKANAKSMRTGVVALLFAATGAVLAGYATFGLTESPRDRVLAKIQTFWQKMKSLEPTS